MTEEIIEEKFIEDYAGKVRRKCLIPLCWKKSVRWAQPTKEKVVRANWSYCEEHINWARKTFPNKNWIRSRRMANENENL